MKGSFIRSGIAWGLSVLLSSCAKSPDPAKSSLGEARMESAGMPRTIERDPELDGRFLEVARDYETYGRVDDEFRWAPYLCRMPMPSQPRFSQAEASSPHARKLYYVFARRRDDYCRTPSQSQPLGQVLVKESWIPEEVPAGDAKPDRVVPFHEVPHVRRTLSRDGRSYAASKKSGLYIMIKTGGPDTDEGWVYGTVSAEGQVTSSGRVRSCISCHGEAKHDRLFGLPVSHF